MKKADCPACGAEINFRSRAIVCVMCAYCRSLIVRHDLDLQAVGKFADLKEEITPLQIGTTGSHRGKRFSLIGRIQREWDGGFWSEWHALFDDMTTGWLAQAQGSYSFLFPWRVPPALVDADAVLAMKPGSTAVLGNNTYTVCDIKQSKITNYEGELPKVHLHAGTTHSVDLSGPDDRCATIEVSGAREVALFVGSHSQFEDLALANLRSLDGW